MEFQVYRKKLADHRLVFALKTRMKDERKWNEENYFEDMEKLTAYLQSAIGNYA